MKRFRVNKLGKIKILYVITGLSIGGAEKALLALVSHLDREKYSVIVCSLKTGGAIGEEMHKQGIKVMTLARGEKLKISIGINFIPKILRLARIIEKEKPQIIHTFLFQANIATRFAAYIVRRKVVSRTPVVISSIRAYRQSMGFGEMWYNLFDRLTYRLTDKIISVSKGAKNYIVKQTGIDSRKIVVIHNGVDIDFYDPKIRGEKEKYNLSKNSMVIGAIGRLCIHKGYKYLLRAAVKVIERFPDARFWIIGEGYLRKRLERESSLLGISKNVTFWGCRRDIPEMLSLIDIFVLSSLSEGLSNTLLEAMAMQKPVIATDIPGNDEVVTGGVDGILVPPANRQKLAEAIISLIEDPDKAREIGEKARKKIIENFREKKMIQKTEAIYHEISFT